MDKTDIINSLLRQYGSSTINLVFHRLFAVLGEAIACTELQNLGIDTELCRGNKRSVDIVLKHTKLRIQVKTSRAAKFVTRLAQRGFNNPDSPNFWVLVKISENGSIRFFVLSHSEICEIQKAGNAEYARKHLARHGEPYDISKGVDNVTLASVENYEDKWFKILDATKSQGVST